MPRILESAFEKKKSSYGNREGYLPLHGAVFRTTRSQAFNFLSKLKKFASKYVAFVFVVVVV